MKREAWRWDGVGFETTALSATETEAVERHPALSTSTVILVLPPLWDHHGHITWLGAASEEVDLRGTASVEEALARVRDFSGRLGMDDWVVGSGWDQNRWGGVMPNLAGLDEASGGRPAYLRRIDTHAAWVNRVAMAAVGLSGDAPDPPGGALMRRLGEFTGVLLDRALEPFEALLSAGAAGRVSGRILAGLGALWAKGLQGATDMSLDRPTLEAFAVLDREGGLSLPVDGFLSPAVEAHPEVFPALSGPAFRLAGRKLFMDGALGSRGAALEDDYSDEPGNRGLLVECASGVKARLHEARERRWTLAAHAIGDRALGVFLEAAESFGKPVSVRIEHLQVVREEDLPRLARLRATASLQPCHALSDAPWAATRLGSRTPTAYRLASLDKACAGFLLGTDFPIEPPDPRRTLFACLSAALQESIPLGRAFQGMAPPHGRVAPGAATLAAGEPWNSSRNPGEVLGWELCAFRPPQGVNP